MMFSRKQNKVYIRRVLHLPGGQIHVRFEDTNEFADFLSKVRNDQREMVCVTLGNGERVWVRPSEVGAIFLG